MPLEPTALPRTAEAIAAMELRDAIVRGALSPGDQIRQAATAGELGISLIPLREALKTLASEGMVTYQPQRGYFVTELQADAISEIYVVRDLLENRAEQVAIPRLPGDALTRIQNHLDSQARAIDDRDAVELIAANRRFHFAIFDECGNALLLRLISQLWDTLDPYRVLSYRRMWLRDSERDVPAEILVEHQRILGALRRGNADRALTLLVKHRTRSETFLRLLVTQLPAEGESLG